MARTLRVLFDDALALNPAGTGTFTRGIQTPLSRLDGIELIPAGSAARPHQLDIVNKGVLRRMRNGADRVWYYLDTLPRLAARDRVHVAYPGPSPELMQADPQPALPDDAPFLLMVGTLEPRKNHVTALRAFARYRQGPHDARLRLVMAGSPGWRYQPVVDEIERLGLQDAVVRLGPVTPGRLKWLYQHARALL